MIENPENSLPNVTGTSSATSVFVYDGDGNRVKSTINTMTTAFIGNHTEWDVSSSSLTRYYYASSTRVAMRKNNTVYYLLSDHLGSTSLTTDQNGQNPVKQYYLPWGEVRYTDGTLQTKYTYTGQYSNVTDFGLMYYNARYYDPLLSRFSSADTIVPQPGNPLDWDRDAYVSNNVINHTDPTGHRECDIDCQIEYQLVDTIAIHYGESYYGCWGPQECLGIEPGTVFSKAIAGDPGSIVDAIVPTTLGIRAQAEIVPKTPFCIVGFCIPYSFSGGVNYVFNRVDGVVSFSLDGALEIGPAFQPTPLIADFSVTAGPLFTWGASQAQQVTTGTSSVTSGTVSGGKAFSIAIIIPGNPLPDPVYGVRPATLFLGAGAGTGYVSGGSGISHTFSEISFSILDFLR
jgi:RHS repeat-associated protein